MRKRNLKRGHYDASDIARFMEKIIPEPNSGCWLWNGSYFKNRGYGQFSIANRKTIPAHRFSYFMHKCLPISNGRPFICHSCDVECCVNPDHLWPGTPLDNMVDKMNKGRASRLPGEANPMSKLTENDIIYIRSDNRTLALIASDYGVSLSAISSIKLRKTWAHIK
jgi:hypothetical protein